MKNLISLINTISSYLISSLSFFLFWIIFFFKNTILFIVLIEAFICIRANKNQNYISSIVSDNIQFLKIITSIIKEIIYGILKLLQTLGSFIP